MDQPRNVVPPEPSSDSLFSSIISTPLAITRELTSSLIVQDGTPLNSSQTSTNTPKIPHLITQSVPLTPIPQTITPLLGDDRALSMLSTDLDTSTSTTASMIRSLGRILAGRRMGGGSVTALRIDDVRIPGDSETGSSSSFNPSSTTGESISNTSSL
ncbi:hypothetical protein BLNAU_9460 [Blattamonas nauphoetae]|uniref:Uncharacterized protein n=1 Tax=Blattamonas nauphoetae TaxID=2049346 RepID=A0ABQ9XVU3_9EUKA|nr:hypothetical protein BLNAU_9460 [Blattamonas nauphoetae]